MSTKWVSNLHIPRLLLGLHGLRARPQVRSRTAHAPVQVCATTLAKSALTCIDFFLVPSISFDVQAPLRGFLLDLGLAVVDALVHDVLRRYGPHLVHEDPALPAYAAASRRSCKSLCSLLVS